MNHPTSADGIPAGTWVIIPVYNEAAVLAGVLSNVLTVYDHVVCVDDGSSDNSASIVAATSAHLVRHPINLGQGAALQTGIEYALRDSTARYFVTYDSDGQHRLQDAVAMTQLIARDEPE